MMSCYANDVMMLWYANDVCAEDTHTFPQQNTQSLCRLFFGVPAMTFRCKPPLGASSPSISAVFALTFRASPYTLAESAFIFRCKLCIPFGTTFEQKTYAVLP
jgi:hypothetical protein